ncbi:MAG TPA: hypothetical protein VIY51_20725 [Xanthobacteraceae bacterium]
MTDQLLHEPNSKAPAPRRGRATPNPTRFPRIVNICVSTEIGDAVDRAKQSFAGLGYTESDVVRLALFEWTSAKGYFRHHSGNGQEANSV